jgi:hypothetical protein
VLEDERFPVAEPRGHRRHAIEGLSPVPLDLAPIAKELHGEEDHRPEQQPDERAADKLATSPLPTTDARQPEPARAQKPSF